MALVPIGIRCQRGALVAALAVGGFAAALLLAPVARAEDGEGEGEGGVPGVQSKVKEQMEKILKLMRENEDAILAASQSGGKKPAGATVDVPDSPKTSEGSTTPGARPDGKPEGAGVTPGARGDDIRRKMEELIRSTQDGGGTIPKELEELVKMIPT